MISIIKYISRANIRSRVQVRNTTAEWTNLFTSRVAENVIIISRSSGFQIKYNMFNAL